MKQLSGVLAVVFGVASSAAPGIEPQGDIAPRHYVCYRTAGELTIDGKLEEPSWQMAAWTDLFIDIEGDLKPRPRFGTRAKMLWDDAYFYVAADMEEPHLWATVAQRDVPVYVNHDFEVFIDPDGDTHEYYELEMNALNTVWDLMSVWPHRDGGAMINAWDIAGLQTGVDLRGSLNDNTDRDDGWSVELAFPWKVLREAAHRPTPPGSGDQWRVNFSRVEQHTENEGKTYRRKDGVREDNWVWSPQGLIAMHYPEMWGYVQFSVRVVGQGTDEFVSTPDVEAREALCRIFYRQKDYHGDHGQYTDDLDELGLGEEDLRYYRWPPQLQVTDSMFEAVLEEREDIDGDGLLGRWHIRHDSKMWSTFRPSGG